MSVIYIKLTSNNGFTIVKIIIPNINDNTTMK